MKNRKLFAILSLLLLAAFFVSCSRTVEQLPDRPSDVLTSKSWQTSNVRNSTGRLVGLKDPNVIKIIEQHYSTFNRNGTFRRFNTKDELIMQGNWSISADGKIITLIAKNGKGETLPTQTLNIIVLNFGEFTYRFYPNSNDKSVFYDIINSPIVYSPRS